MNEDDEKNIHSNPNPKLYANCLSKLVFSWLFGFFTYGRNHIVETKDLYDVLFDNLSENLGDKFESCWITEVTSSVNKQHEKPKLSKVICKVLGWSFMKYGIHLLVLNVIIRVSQPIILERLIWHFDSNSTVTIWNICKYALILGSLMILEVILVNHANYGLKVIGMRLKIGCSSLIYRKVTKVSSASISKFSDKSIVDLLSNDVIKFETIFTFLHQIWTIPLKFIAMVYLIWRKIGDVTYFNIFFMIVTTVPIQFLLDMMISKLHLKMIETTDNRIHTVNELIHGIRSLKMYVWEKPFETLVSNLRKKEIEAIKKYSYPKIISISSLAFVNQTTLFFTLFLLYAIQGNTINAATVYTITYCYYYLHISLTCQFPKAVCSLIRTRHSVDRIQKFLLLDEITKQPVSVDELSQGSLSIKHVNAKWSEKSISNTLHNIDLHFAPKQLHALVGQTSPGKNFLLKLILGELHITNGEISISGIISYASRDPWIFANSIRNNIIFGENYDETKYRRVLRACDLDDEMERLIDNDRTIVGDGGVALSKSLLVRINLARAVYRDADIYLLDDLLSNLDPQGGQQLFDDCINGLLKDKTRILVTNQVSYLKKVDGIIVLNNGQIEFQGYFNEFIRNEELFKLLPPYRPSRTVEDDSLTNDMSLMMQNNVTDENEDEIKETVDLVEHQTISDRRSSCWRYLRFCGSCSLITSTVVCFFLAQSLLVGSTSWIARWIEIEETDSNYELLTIGISNVLSVIVSLLANTLLLKLCMRANLKVHSSMLTSVLSAPLSFFDGNNSTNRMIEKFTDDVHVADVILPITFIRTIQWCWIVIGNVVLVLIVNWTMLFPLIVMFCLCKRIKDAYLATARNLKRLEDLDYTSLMVINGLLTCIINV